jgi:uncharacterized protein (TIGR00297 family)
MAARRGRTLTSGAAAAAVLLGTVATAAGWSWAILLVAFFASATVLTRMESGRKLLNTAGTGDAGGERDAMQVLANGGLFGAVAILSLMTGNDLWLVAATGAIAASTADTWATEIGTAASGSARSLLTFRKVQAGTSGAITLRGTLAAIAGSAFIAGIILGLGHPIKHACAAVAGGIVGSLLDSLVGATLQSQRWCDQCGVVTEGMTHTCGNSTSHRSGFAWLDNDGVNALASAGGALAGIVCAL